MKYWNLYYFQHDLDFAIRCTYENIYAGHANENFLKGFPERKIKDLER